jgi:hypothetical protein
LKKSVLAVVIVCCVICLALLLTTALPHTATCDGFAGCGLAADWR